MTTKASHVPKPLLAVAVFLVLYFLARLVLKQPDLAQPLRVTVALLPIPVFALFLLSFIRGLKALDELERRIQLEALVIAFPLAILLIMMLGLLELAVPLSPENWSYRHIWPFLTMFYFIGLAIARKRYQ